MTAAELDAVCVRHGIETISAKNDTVAEGFLARYTEEFGRLGIGDTEAAAVCALLKARWGIMTGWYTHSDGTRRWVTQCDALMDQHEYATELAAVVALADRLTEAAP